MQETRTSVGNPLMLREHARSLQEANVSLPRFFRYFFGGRTEPILLLNRYACKTMLESLSCRQAVRDCVMVTPDGDALLIYIGRFDWYVSRQELHDETSGGAVEHRT